MNTRNTGTIHRQLTRITMIVSTLAILAAGTVFAVFHFTSSWRLLVQTTTNLARGIADNSKAALEFEDITEGRRILDGLATQPEVIEALILDGQGTRFASFQRDIREKPSWNVPLADGSRFESGHLIIVTPIIHNSQRLGTLHLRRDIREIHDQALIYGLLGLFSFGLVFTGARWLAGRLQHPISGPILDLAEKAAKIAVEKDFSIRVATTGTGGSGEIHLLFEAVNLMLSEIEQRDNQLALHRRELETRVAERTAELTASESRYRLLFEDHPLPMWLYATESKRFLAVNESTVRHYGYSRAEFLSMTVGDVGLDEHASVHHRANGLAMNIEAVSHAFSFMGQDARLVAVNDVTARKRAEAELREANEKLLDVSRRAGMAEVATGVLHNVGNVLNSVNVAATLIAERAQTLRVESLVKAATLIEQKSADPAFFQTDQGRALPGFLQKLAQHFGGQREYLAGEIQSLNKNIEHIKEIVAMQQNYATAAGVTAPLDMAELVEDALKLVSGSFDRHKVELEKRFTNVPAVTTDRHKVLQVLVNLLRNASQALKDNTGTRKITVTIARHGDRVAISITDNGIGIARENLSKIFSHGFTTKKEGHGFGLHSGALAARELGGNLHVASEGHAHGATFTLELPLTQKPALR